MTVRPTKQSLVTTVRKRLGRELTRDELYRLARAMQARQLQQRVYKPRMELWDDGESARITAVFELPGLGPNEVLVDVVDGRLIVSGERRPRIPSFQRSDGIPGQSKSPAGATTSMLQVRELKYGTFRRVIAMPEGCTTNDLEASLENGMLTVTWPRHPLPELARVQEIDSSASTPKIADEDKSDDNDTPTYSPSDPYFGDNDASGAPN
ncbi:HSP20-like chaperone [Cubamyces sp. BRFM 1775]|nr:HSP20-like chaperone [Cubamyces sp. BRFM 1775]